MKKWGWFILSLVIILIDQATKYLAVMHLVPYQPNPLLPGLNFTLAFNTGAAFSFLSGAGGWHRWFFAGFSLIMSTVLVIWISRLPKNAYLQACALAFILGGAAGNLIDRMYLGYVVDFIELYYQNHHWPVFNVADMAICLGAFLLLIDITRSGTK